MSGLATLLLGAAALLLHAALLAGATLLLIEDRAPGATRRRVAPAATLRALLALAAKEPVRAANGSRLASAAPVLVLGLSLCAALLVPSFATGLPDAALADSLLVLALLACARAVLLLAAADGGAALPGLAAVSGIVDGLLASPGALLAILALSLWSGGTGLDGMLASAPAGGGSWLRPPAPAGVAAGAALGLAALAGSGHAGSSGDPLRSGYSGPDLLLVRLGGALQRVAWIDLVGALCWPGSLAAVESGPLPWLGGLSCWSLRFAIGVLLLRAADGRVADTGRRRGLALLSLLLAALGPMLLLARRGLE